MPPNPPASVMRAPAAVDIAWLSPATSRQPRASRRAPITNTRFCAGQVGQAVQA